MKGLVPIKEVQKPAICFKSKANEIITKRCNVPWTITMPDGNVLFGTGEVQYGENEIKIDLSNMSFVRIKVCDTEGNNRTAVILGYFEDEV